MAIYTSEKLRYLHCYGLSYLLVSTFFFSLFVLFVNQQKQFDIRTKYTGNACVRANL